MVSLVARCLAASIVLALPAFSQAPPRTPPSVTTTAPLPTALTGTAYAETLTAFGSTPITWAVTTGALPAGLTLDPSSGLIGGTPTVLGAAAFAVTATNPFGSSSQNLSLPVGAAPSILTGLPMTPALVNTSFLQSLTASGSTPITWSLSSGALPAGLTLNSASGLISGIPTGLGAATFTVEATNAFGSNFKDLSLTVNGAPAITTSSPLPAGQTGAAYSQTLSASGTAPITWSVSSGALPAGLTLDATTGVVSGTPTAMGAATFAVSASNAFGSGLSNLSVTVNGAPAITTTAPLPAGQTGMAYSQTLSASGSTPITWAVTGGALPAGLTLNTATGLVSGTPAAMGLATFTVGATNAFGSSSKPLSLTVNGAPSITITSPLPAAQTGTAYSQTLSASGTTPITWAVSGGALPAGLTLNSSTGSIGGTPMASGLATLTITAYNAFGSGSQQLSISVNAAPSIVTTSPLPAAQMGTAYSFALAASGSTPMAWALTSGALPAGLALNASSGFINGTPTAQGVATFTVTATNGFGASSLQLSLTVGGPPQISTASPLPNAKMGTAYSQTLNASGSTPITWAVTGGALPAGLSLNASTGVISGTPTAQDVATFTVSATNAFGASSVPLSLAVNATPSITTTSTLPSAQTGTAYSLTLSAAGSTPITWALTSGALPAGLSLNGTSGLIGGTATAQGVATFSVAATNAYGTSSQQLSLTVNGLPQISSTPPLPAARLGTVYSQTLSASGSTPILWQLTGGALPAGLTLNGSTGAVSGTPSALGTATFTVSATNAFGGSSLQFSLAVNATPSIATASVLPAAQVGAAYSQTLSASGSTPIAWALTSGVLPAGLTFNTATALISGTPAAQGATSFTVTATNAFGSGSEQLSLTVNAPVGISLSPATATLYAAQTTTLVPTVSGSSNTGVVWSLNPAIGTISGGLYTAPASIASSQVVTVTAASAVDPAKFATASLTLNPAVSVTLSPASATLGQSQTQAFSATVANSSNSAVTWWLSPAVGTISSSGVYTAPASIATTQSVTVIATSVSDPTKSAVASLTLNPPVSLSLTPPTVTLNPSQNQSFTASVSNASNSGVTWSLSPAVGTISTSTNGATAVYTAPNTVNLNQNVQITATSMADSTKFAQAVVSLLSAVTVSVAPAGITLNESQTQTFNATVTGASSTAVTWALSSPIGTVSTAGMYTAPASLSDVQTVQVIAQSVVNPTQSSRVPLTLLPTKFTVSVSPASVSLKASQTQSFAALVSGITNSAVTWSLNPAVGTISAGGLYTAPSSIPTDQTVVVTAASVANPAIVGTATVVLVAPVTISLTPATTSLLPSQTQSLTATVAGGSSAGVTWAVNPSLGSFASSPTTATFIAPSTAPTTQTVTITATSVADPSKSASAVFTLLQTVTLVVSPSSVSIAPSGTQQFTAAVSGSSNTAVTWSISPTVGTISSSGLYTAPTSIAAAQTVTVTAQSVADKTKTATGRVTLASQTWAITMSSKGPSSLIYNGVQYSGGTSNYPIVYGLGTGSNCSNSTYNNDSNNPTRAFGSNYVQYTYGAVKLRQTVVDAGNGVLHLTFLWTSLDPVNTLCWVATPALVLAAPSPGLTSSDFGVSISYDQNPAEIVNASPNSLAIWSGQTYSNKGIQMTATQLVNGVQTISLASGYTSGAPIYNDVISYANPIAPLGTFSVDVYLAAGPPNATMATLAAPALAAQNATLPVTIPLANREAVCTWFMSAASYKNANNPRGYFNPTLNALNPTAMQAAINSLVGNVINNCQQAHGQAVYIWDVEGREFNGWTYMGHPSLLPQVAPEMDAVIDSAVAAIQAAGMDVGFTLRPQKLLASNGPPATCNSANTTNASWSSTTTYSGGGGQTVQYGPSPTFGTSGYSTYIGVPTLYTNVNKNPTNSSFWYLADYWNDTAIDTSRINTYPLDPLSNLYCSYTNTWSPDGQAQIMQTQQKSLAAVQAVLQTEINYAHARWGNRVRFYVDSNAFQSPYDTSLWNALIAANPGIYFSPEQNLLSDYSVVFPYVTGDSLGASNRAINPQYFGMVAMGSDASAVAGIAAGDVPRVNGTWYTNSDAQQQMANRAAAIAINSSMTITDINSGTQHTYKGSPGSIKSYPVVMREYFADNAADLAGSTAYCEMRGTATCYQSGVSTGGATINLSGLSASQLRYYDFAGNFIQNGQ